MNIYLLRHGIAADTAPGGGGDADRPLTKEGEAKLLQVVEAMRAMELGFDLVLASPYLRARQTAEIVAAALRLKKLLKLTKTLEPDGQGKALIEEIKAAEAEDVLLVGHEPSLSELIGRLIGGDRIIAIQMKKGGLAKLGVERLLYGRCGTLQWLLTPAQMRLMAPNTGK
jgi:phosphohistidine phosphatase